LIYVNYLTSMGRFEESVAIARRTVERDPLSPDAYESLGFALEYLGRDAEALEHYKKALELGPDMFRAHLLLAEFYLKRGRFDEASRLAERAESVLGGEGSPTWVGHLGFIFARANRGRPAHP